MVQIMMAVTFIVIDIIRVLCSCLFQVKTTSYHPPEMPHLGRIQVKVTAVGDDGLIYMRTHNAGCSFCISLLTTVKFK